MNNQEAIYTINKIASILSDTVIQNKIKLDNKTYNNCADVDYQAKSFQVFNELSSFVINIYMYSNLTVSSLINSLVYIDQAVLEKKYILTVDNIKSMLLGSLMISIKYNQDLYNVNQFSAVAGISRQELVRVEETFLDLIDYKAYVSVETYALYEENLFQL